MTNSGMNLKEAIPNTIPQSLHMPNMSYKANLQQASLTGPTSTWVYTSMFASHVLDRKAPLCFGSHLFLTLNLISTYIISIFSPSSWYCLLLYSRFLSIIRASLFTINSIFFSEKSLIKPWFWTAKYLELMLYAYAL